VKIYISDISADLKAMAGLLGRGSEAAAFQFFHFAFQERTLEVTAANLDSGVTRSFPAQVETPVTLLVPPGFIDVIAGLGDVIALTITADEIRIQAGAFDGTVKCLAADDYPQLPTTQLHRPITLTPAAFNQLLGVSPYADPAASLALEGILFSWETYQLPHSKQWGLQVAMQLPRPPG
jgi:DNA polymerase III sliding clamp (beta) subunit (PCNA family)